MTESLGWIANGADVVALRVNWLDSNVAGMVHSVRRHRCAAAGGSPVSAGTVGRGACRGDVRRAGAKLPNSMKGEDHG